jgi:predicted alpha/beta-fold hydrolase
MPLITSSSYEAPPLLRDGHALTVFPTLSRRVDGVDYQRSRLELVDGDFLDLDVSSAGAGRAVVISHGLEGHTDRAYVKGMVRAFNRAGWDAVAWNFRGSSGEPNRLLKFTHSGATEDLGAVVDAVRGWRRYRTLALVGFSLGGNLTLKYLGERGDQVPSEIRAAVAFSVPCDLRGAAERMGAWGNRIYMRRFMADLRERMEVKARQFPGKLDLSDYDRMKTFREFDDRYTAPLHGFADAEEYWRRSGSGSVVGGIRVPTLLVNAEDDPFLSDTCFPRETAGASEWFYLESPRRGGHVGFVQFTEEGDYWSERRAVGFVGEQAGDR